MNEYSYALGYGFWCNEECARRKMEAGIPPLGASRAQKAQSEASEALIAQAALEKQRKQTESGWSPLAVGGVVLASLVGITIMVVAIKRAK